MPPKVDFGRYLWEAALNVSSHRSKDSNSSIQPKLRITPTASALNGFVRQFRIECGGSQGPREFMQIARPEVQKIMRENRQTRVKVILNCEMSRKELFSESVEILQTCFHSETVQNLEATDESAAFDSFIETIEERIQNFNQRGSNWRFERIISLDIQLTDFIPLRGTSYIPLRKKLVGKRAIINMKNGDNQCFKWCVTRALFPVVRDSERISKNLRKHSKEINWEGTTFPTELKDIKTFEKLNEKIAVNIFGYDGVIYPLRLYKGRNREHEINLLLISDDGSFASRKKHHCLIKNMSRLVSKQLSKHDGAKEICFKCTKVFPQKRH